MAKKYNPWTGFLEDTATKANDEKPTIDNAIRNCDSNVKLVKTVAKKNGYAIHIVSGKYGERIVLTFPGENYNNPHMWLGSNTPSNISKAQEMLLKFAARANDSKCKTAVDKAIRNCDEEGERWITMRGSHVKIDGEGNAVAGNEKVKSIINKGKSAKSNAQGNVSSSYTPAKNYSDFKKKTGADAMIENVYDITYDREHEKRSFTEEEIDKISQGILDVFEKGKEDPNFGKYVNKIRKEVNSMFRETSGTTLYDHVFEGKKDKNGDRKINYVLRTFNKYYE